MPTDESSSLHVEKTVPRGRESNLSRSKRIAVGTATFLVKVKAHRGEPANEGADILANKAISDPKVGKEWCQRTNRAVFTWRKPCREAGKVTYQGRHSTFKIA